MSSFFSFPSMALLISLFALASLLASPTLSTPMDSTPETIGFMATLSHVDHGKSLTKTELLQRAIQRSTKRVETRQAIMAQLASKSPSPSSLPTIKVPISGKYYSGEFSMSLAIGTPPKSHNVIIDTDTDLMWIDQCDNHSTSNTKLSCSSNLCKKVGSCTKKGVCQYKYQYSSSKTVQVDLATEAFTFGKNVPKLGFSCGVALEGVVANGGVGLGHGPLSLVSQMNATNFTLCLPSYDNPNKKGFVLIGSPIKTSTKMVTASLIKNNFFTSKYYINVTGISIGEVKLNIKPSSFSINPIDGTGGVVIDTGSTVTYLEQSIFDQVKNEFKKLPISFPTSIDNNTKLPICFPTPPYNPKNKVVPYITFHLGGPNGPSNLTLSIDNTYREYDNVGEKKKTCLAIKPAPLSDNGMSSLGNIQLQNTLVAFDLSKNTVAFLFLPNKGCDKM